ncbi:MAG: zinc ABC transporter substrate-binding protein [Oligoflexales bacterium]|nr:zinc ABC transporter substrate-binding protein [Oligoflexales bacterium]
MIFKTLRLFTCLLGLSGAAIQGAERLSVISSIPDIAWLASEIGGIYVESKPLLKGNENPHYVDAVPEFIRLAADAQIVCMVGLDLEVGYMPAVRSRSGNAAIQLGGKGYCDAGKGVTVLDKPVGGVDRSMGDVHPTGNPHYYLSPKSMAEAAKEIEMTLSRVDPVHTADYKSSLVKLVTKLEKIGETNRAKIAALKLQSKNVLIEYHREFTYFLDYYGLSSLGSIEEKPGVPPSAGRIAELAISAKAAGVRFVLATDYSPAKTLKRFSELSGIPVVVVPTMIQSYAHLNSYEDVQNKIIDSIVKTVRELQGGGEGEAVQLVPPKK